MFHEPRRRAGVAMTASLIAVSLYGALVVLALARVLRMQRRSAEARRVIEDYEREIRATARTATIAAADGACGDRIQIGRGKQVLDMIEVQSTGFMLRCSDGSRPWGLADQYGEDVPIVTVLREYLGVSPGPRLHPVRRATRIEPSVACGASELLLSMSVADIIVGLSRSARSAACRCARHRDIARRRRF